jgi:hypothetical protein
VDLGAKGELIVQQFNCVVGDTVLLATRKGGKGRWKTERLTLVKTGILNDHGCPLDFMAADANGQRIQLSPFTNDDGCRVIIIPPISQLPQIAKRLFAKNPKFKASLIVARCPGRGEYTYQILCSQSLEPVTLIRTEVCTRDISFTEDEWYLCEEEVINTCECLRAGRLKLPTELLPMDIIDT